MQVSSKPIRSCYLTNQHHKQKQCRKVWLYMSFQGFDHDKRSYLFDGNWNHKKTNAQKAMWSCGGYGGKCRSCKMSNNYGNHKRRREVYEFGGEERYFDC